MKRKKLDLLKKKKKKVSVNDLRSERIFEWEIVELCL